MAIPAYASEPWVRTASGRYQYALVPGLLVFCAVTFNAGLAFVNAHFVPLTPASVMAVEATLVLAAHLLALANYHQSMQSWYALLSIFILIAILRALALGQLELKYLRDVALIPTFIILGLSFQLRNLTKTVLAIHGVVLAFLLLEALDTPLFSELFRVQDYYVNTRGLSVQDFWNKGSSLFVSATRPEERFFSFVPLHRLSSVFLEPVSLGNYCTIMTAFICARFSHLRLTTRWFLIVSNIALIIGCDGRLTAVSSLIVAMVALVASRLPKYSVGWYLPGIVLVSFALVQIAGFRPGVDNFAGRLAQTVDLLSHYDVPELMGVSEQYLSVAVDSGLAYLIATQSIFGLCLVWLFVVYGAAENTPGQARFNSALWLYVSLSLMVSYGLFTIKTAALLWFIYGCLQTDTIAQEPAQLTAKRDARVSLPGSALG